MVHAFNSFLYWRIHTFNSFLYWPCTHLAHSSTDANTHLTHPFIVIFDQPMHTHLMHKSTDAYTHLTCSSSDAYTHLTHPFIVIVDQPMHTHLTHQSTDAYTFYSFFHCECLSTDANPRFTHSFQCKCLTYTYWWRIPYYGTLLGFNFRAWS